MKISEEDRSAVVGISDAYNQVGCSNLEGASAFYDMAIALVLGSENPTRLAASEHYKERNNND